VECKLRCVNFRRVSDCRRASWPPFGVTEISDNWYRSTMGVIVTSLGTPWSAGDSIGCTSEHLGTPATSLEALATSLEAPETSMGASATSLGVLMTKCRQQLWEHLKCQLSSLGKTSLRMLQVVLEILATTYHSTVVKTHVFRLYSHLCILVSIYRYNYPSSHNISGLAAGGAWEQFDVHLKMTLEWTQRYTPRPWFGRVRRCTYRQ